MTRKGLLHPVDLNAWQKWQHRQNSGRRLKSLLRPDKPSTAWLAVRGESPSILVAVDARTPTQRASLLRPLELLGRTDAAVLLPGKTPAPLPDGDWRWIPIAIGKGVMPYPRLLGGVRVTLSVGHYLPIGALANRWATALSAEQFVVQHGLLTPYAPPLPRNAHLFAFTDADGQFATLGRTDVTSTTVGSQLLWEAGSSKAKPVGDRSPLYLGQLHGAELPRRHQAHAATEFCRTTGSAYRPHPAEKDILSRLQHNRWARQGIEIDLANTALSEAGRPVVSAFSTGILEAAAWGLPSWVTYPNPPRWLAEFWDRYSMRSWGSEPTPAPFRNHREPAAVIAEQASHFAGIS